MVGRIKSMKYSNDTIGNRTCDFPACSALSQPTASPRVPVIIMITIMQQDNVNVFKHSQRCAYGLFSSVA